MSATGITVTGTGEATAPADLVRLTLTVGHDAAEVATAVAEVAERSESVLAALRAEGVGSDDVHTSAVAVHPQYGDAMVVTAYRAAHTLTVRTTDLTGFGRLLTAAIAAVGNSLGLDFVQFDIADKAPLVERARELAFAQARERADRLAGLAGRPLGPIAAVLESQGHSPLRESLAAPAAARAYAADLAVSPGDQVVQVAVEVRWDWA